jgi:general secretion pathway protein D
MSATTVLAAGEQSQAWVQAQQTTLGPAGLASASPLLALNTASTTTASTKTATTKTQQPLKQVWNLQNADIRAVIQTMSSLTGKNFVIDPRVQGKITIVSKKPMTVKELYRVFLSMLQILGFAAVPAGNVVKVVPAMNAKEYAGTAVTGKGTVPIGDDNVVVRVAQVNNVSAAQLVPILRPLMHDWGSIMAYTPSNALILAGSADNVARLVKIVHTMDEKNASEIQESQLRYASATKLVKVLQQLQQDDRAEGKVTNLSFAADAESNSVLISGNKVNILSAQKLIRRLDLKSANGNGGIEVVRLKYLEAKDMVTILTKLVHGHVSAGSSSDASSGGASSSGSSSSSTASSSSPLGVLSAGGNKDISIVAEKSSNALLISAPAEVVTKLNRVIHRLDTRPEQVLVEAIIVQVDDSMVNKLGVRWGTMSQDSGSSDSSGNSLSQALNGFQPGVGFIRDVTIKGLLTALKNIANTNVLATPSIVVLNNKKAVISDGVNVGIQNRQYATTDTGGGSSSGDDSSNVPFTTTQRTDVTLKLTVTPQISPNKTIMLKIDQSNRQLDPTASNSSSDNPTIDTSEIKTNVLVNSGDILVLGGLIQNQRKRLSTRVPILGDIPLLGRLFQYNTKDYEKKNLMIFLKPIILSSGSDNQKVSLERYRYMQAQQIKKAAGESLVTRAGPMLPTVTGIRAGRLQLPPPFHTHG